MKVPSISILIPVYKVEQYLHRCIDSVLSQNFKDWEMILVDDGSPDRCGEICDEYAVKYPEFIRVIHKDNGGLPSARLAGFQNAGGKYIMFLDSDDYLLPNALSVLYNKILEGYDIVKGNNWRLLDNGNYRIEKPNHLGKEILSSQEYLSSIINYNILPYLWGGLYRKDLFSEDIFVKVTTISICEDWITNQLIWKNVHRYYSLDAEVCVYYINPESMMQSKVVSSEYHKRLYEMMRTNANGCNNILQAIDIESIKTMIRCFFIPELNWDESEYYIIKTFLKNKDLYNYICNNIEKKFILGINYKYIYKIYSQIYKMLFKIFKLKGKTRKVIY